MVTLITREEWGARPPLWPLTQVPWSRRVGVAFHYSAGSKFTTPKQLQEYAQTNLGYSDGHYNVLVDYRGQAFEGRGWTVSAAHSEGENVEWIGICFIGRDADVTSEAERTMAALAADAERLAGRKLRLAGHQELPGAQTSCPGPRLMALVDRLRAEGGDDMTPEEREMLTDLHNVVIKGVRGPGRAWTHTVGGKSQPINPLYNAIWQLGQGVAQLGVDMPDVIPVDVDEAAIAAAVVQQLPLDALVDALDDDLAAALLDRLRERLAS